MQLTKNDVLFLQQVRMLSRHGGKAIITARAMLSPDLLKIFEVTDHALGFWCFNVYVEFEPLFKVTEAKDWQIPENR